MSNCIIVGAGSGLNHSIAHKIASNGYAISLIARSEGSLQNETQELINGRTKAAYRVADASDEARLCVPISFRLSVKLYAGSGANKFCVPVCYSTVVREVPDCPIPDLMTK